MERAAKGRDVNHLPNVEAARGRFIEAIHELANGLLQGVGPFVIPGTLDSHDLVQLYARVMAS